MNNANNIPQSINPYIVLASSILLPGSGHVMLVESRRGLQFLFFIAVLFWAGNNALPDASWYVRNVGGIFIWGLSVIDAYRIARVRKEVERHGQAVKPS